MQASPLSNVPRYAVLALALVLANGCCCTQHKPSTPPAPPMAHKRCPAKFSYHYVDSAHGFSLCLPPHLTKTVAGSVTFSGFKVPAGTNLISKKLIILSGTDSNLQGATAWGHLTADGVTFHRTQSLDGSAGHMTTYIGYTWTQGSQVLHFDFQLFAVNPEVYPPATRPAAYDLNAQLTDANEIMDTFRLH